MRESPSAIYYIRVYLIAPYIPVEDRNAREAGALLRVGYSAYANHVQNIDVYKLHVLVYNYYVVSCRLTKTGRKERWAKDETGKPEIS